MLVTSNKRKEHLKPVCYSTVDVYHILKHKTSFKDKICRQNQSLPASAFPLKEIKEKVIAVKNYSSFT